MLLVGAFLVVLMIGLRFEVGGDWGSYERMFSFAGYADFGRVMSRGDTGYQFVNWFAQQVGGKFWLVNLICSAIFTWGLLTFARAQPLPWLAILVAVPYLIIVVAMGYTRQAAAIGIIMAGLALLARGGSTLRFALYVVVAALFHKTAIVVLPLVLLAVERNRLLNMLLTGAFFFLLYDVFLSSSTDRLLTHYIRQEYTAQGAAVRVAMGVIPGALFLYSSRRFGFPERERKTWRNFALAAFLFLFLLLLFPSSAAIDRLALYLAPLQIAILSRVPIAYRSKQVAPLAIIFYSFAVQFVWLNYAAHAYAWVPYKSFLTG